MIINFTKVSLVFILIQIYSTAGFKLDEHRATDLHVHGKTIEQFACARELLYSA